MGQFATFISNSFSASSTPRSVVTLLCLCTVGRIPVAIKLRGEGGGGGSANDNESLNKVMETAN